MNLILIFTTPQKKAWTSVVIFDFIDSLIFGDKISWRNYGQLELSTL